MTTLEDLQEARGDIFGQAVNSELPITQYNALLALQIAKHGELIRTLLDEAISKMETSNSRGLDLEGLKREVIEYLNKRPYTSALHGDEKGLVSETIDHIAAQGRILPEGFAYLPIETEAKGIKFRLLGGHYGTPEHIGMTLNTFADFIAPMPAAQKEGE